MKLVFIQDILYEHLGLCYLSAVLKKAGHEVDLIVPSEYKKGKNYLDDMKDADAALFPVAISVEKWFLEKAKEVKEALGIPTIFGGPHTTFYPDIINDPNVDFIVQGEAEDAVLELVNALEKKEDPSNILNVGTKEKINPLRPLADNLDDIPFADRELYYKKYKFLANLPTKRFMSGRGCPRSCTFCYVPSMRKIYRKEDGSMLGKYLRKRSVRNVINEIKDVRSKYSLHTVRFSDDTFGWHRPWFNEFLKIYKEEINLPFTFLFVAGELDEESIKLLSETNISSVYFGIESGNEKIRNDLYKKKVSNEQIYETARLLNKYKIKFGTYNIIGNPNETVEEAFETIKMNAKIKTNYPNCTIAQPYPNTGLYEYAKDNNLLEFQENNGKIDFNTMFNNSVLKLEHKKRFENLQKFFYLGSKFPILIPVIKVLIKLPPNPIFRLIFMASYAHRSFKSFNAGIFDSIKLGFKLRRTLVTGG